MYSVPVDPVVLANRLGIQVKNALFKEGDISGMIAKRGKNAIILVNADDSPSRKRFTIAHEIGHHTLHLRGSDGNYLDKSESVDMLREVTDSEGAAKDPKEVEANYFAAALLMPEAMVRQSLASSKDIEHLARQFQVSQAAMTHRINRIRNS